MRVSFCRCDCGIEIKLLQEVDDTTQAYTCKCGQQIEFLGTLVEIYTAASTDRFPTFPEWSQVPGASMKASA